MSVEQRIVDAGFEDVVYFVNPDYESAFIGISNDNRAVYDYNRMIEFLTEEGMEDEDAADFIEFNTIRALPYIEKDGLAPVIVYRCN